MDELAKVAEAFEIVQRARILNRHGASYDRALRARDRWDGRWASGFVPVFQQHLQPSDWDALARAGQQAWNPTRKIRWAAPVQVLVQVINSVLTAQLGSIGDFVRGAMPIYMSLAHDEADDAGQHTLDQLGLNRTFRWTSARDMPRDPFAVRGSKIIQHAHGTHLDELRKIIIEATDPARPRTQGEVRRDIRERWNRLTSRQVERIARTEVAAVWNTTTVNAQLANDVRWFDISVAKGPSIGPPKSEDVCRICLAAAAGGPYPIQELPDVPIHPQCRCVTIPSLSRDWLPPREPWAGGPWPEGVPFQEAADLGG